MDHFLDHVQAEPDKNGRLYAEWDGRWYYIVDCLENSQERRVLSSNSLAHIKSAAERFSTGKGSFKINNGNVLIIDGKTHKALAFYQKDKGLIRDWAGENISYSKRRRRAYRERRSLIVHRSQKL